MALNPKLLDAIKGAKGKYAYPRDDESTYEEDFIIAKALIRFIKSESKCANPAHHDICDAFRILQERNSGAYELAAECWSGDPLLHQREG